MADQPGRSSFRLAAARGYIIIRAVLNVRIRNWIYAGAVMVLALIETAAGDSTMTDKKVTLPDLYEIWNYNEPAATRAKFEEILPLAEKSGDKSYHLQLLTQIARTLGLEANLDSAHALLNKVEVKLSNEYPIVRVRYLLERGRAFNSENQKEKAMPLFIESFEIAKQINEDFYAVDAAHMVAIAAPDFAQKEKWSLVGIEIAEQSENPRTRKWLGSLYNNMGWDYFEQKQYESALGLFEKALTYREEQGNQELINIARWSIAKTYRFLNRIDDALAIQKDLLAISDSTGSSDGYTYEELGELYLISGETAKSREFFARAYNALSQDTWLARNETDRLERMKKLGGVED